MHYGSSPEAGRLQPLFNPVAMPQIHPPTAIADCHLIETLFIFFGEWREAFEKGLGKKMKSHYQSGECEERSKKR
jgi:hypothetical protein